MRYWEDDELETILEDDDDEGIFDEDDDDEEVYLVEDDDDDDEAAYIGEDDEDDDESADLSERRFFRRRSRRKLGQVRFNRFRRLPKRRFNIRGRRTGTIRTRRGVAKVNLGRGLATAAEVKKAFNRLSADIRENGTGIQRLDKAVRKVDKAARNATTNQTNKLSKFEKKVSKQISDAKQQAQQSAFLPLLINSDPQIESITLDNESVLQVTDKGVKYKSDGLGDFLPFLLMGGGLGGGKGYDMMSNPLMMLMLLKAFD